MIHKNSIVICHITLTLFILILLVLPLEEGMIFGSEGDWFSQHVGIGESLKQMMLETGSLIPQYSTLGGGTGIYDFAYYGLLRPDIIFSYFMPEVEMKTIISVYAIIGVIASANICFFWLRKQKISNWFALIGTLLFAMATCFFHAHHQIIFVNYMPFLLLTFLGIDRLIEKGKSELLILSLFLIYMHSFFYAFVCLAVCLLYYLYQSRGRWSLATTGKAVFAVVLSIGMAAVLLVPTAINILSTEKDAGAFLEVPLKGVDFTISGLLYIPYGCGMTLVALYCILLSLTKKKKRILAVVLLLCFMVPVIALMFNGFLYPRAKILIPFMPVVVLIVASTLQELYEGKQKCLILPAILCILPACFSHWGLLILIDGVILLIWILSQRLWVIPDKVKKYTVICLLIIPICLNLGINQNEKYISSKDDRQNHFSFGDINMVASDHRYRFDVLSNNYINSNVLPDGGISKTSMYSSITNSGYADFYYNTMRNPISIRNRVVLMPNQNCFFNYFMGTRYLLASEGQVPYGYEKVFQRGKHILAENQDVLPICYGTSQLLSNKDYEKLNYPDTLEALTSKSVVPVGTIETFTSHMEEQPLSQFFYNPDEDALARCQSARGYTEKVGLDQKFNVMLNKSLKKKVLLISFHVESKKGKQIEVTINGVKNNLSAKSAPYPNKNNDFTFIIPPAAALEELEILRAKGEYTVSLLRVYTLDGKYLNHGDITIPKLEEVKTGQKMEDGKQMVFNGLINMKKDGYFITSYPYREGYEILVNGKQTDVEKVNTTFIGFPIEKGQHKIQIKYVAPGYTTGLRISIVSLILIVMAMIRERKRTS